MICRIHISMAAPVTMLFACALFAQTPPAGMDSQPKVMPAANRAGMPPMPQKGV